MNKYLYGVLGFLVWSGVKGNIGYVHITKYHDQSEPKIE